jgi:hypothetical protein
MLRPTLGQQPRIAPCGGPVSTSFAGTPVRSRSPTAHLLAARDTMTVQSLDALTADIFESDEEPVDFLVLTYAERHRDLP